MPKFRTLDDIDVRGKRVLLRADLNVPIKAGVVTDATRIERLAPTIEALIGKGARVIVMSHFGRPKGGPDPALSLRPLIAPLEKAIAGREVVFAAAHRAHASIAALAGLFPAAAGKLMEAELKALTAALESPTRPVLAIIGGAKVSTKLDLLRFLIGRVDLMAIGGAMANTLLLAEGGEVGRSLCERDMAETARQILALARDRNCRLILPEDAVVAPELAPGTAARNAAIDAVPHEAMILDIGPKTVARIGGILGEARTLVWNGPLGAFETPPFDCGTIAVAKKVGELTRAGRLLSVAGGGDTVAALAQAGVTEELSYVSMAGGAFLEWLEGRELPGVAALTAVTNH